MKYFITFSLTIILSFGVLADVRLQDVPEDHWAAESVYELLKMGVTTGYPDGTFRGKNDISRYETASFLSRLSESLKRERGKREKLVEELSSELSLIKYRIKKKKEEEIKVSGNVESRVRTSAYGTKFDYRLKLNLVKDFDPHTSLRIGFDSVDAGFNGQARDLLTELIDVEGKFRLGMFDYKVTFGPGALFHYETGDFFPSENYIRYERPDVALLASTSLGKMDFSGEYIAHETAATGNIGMQQLTAKVGYNFGRLSFHVRPRYMFIIDGPSDVLADVGIDFRLNKNWETSLLFSTSASREGTYVKVVEKIKDPFKTGTHVVLRFDRAGSKYRCDLDELEFVDLNNFDRLILDGTADIGLRVDQKLSDRFSLELLSDYVMTEDCEYGESYPGTYFLWQAGLNYDLFSGASVNAFYRSYNVPSGIAQFGDPVPEVSDLAGIGLKCLF